MQQQFIDLQDQLNVFREIFCPSSGAWDWDFLQHMVSCCCGRQGFGERQRGPTPRCRSPKPCLPQQDTICCKNLSLTLLKMGKKLPEICWPDLVDQ